MKTQPTEEELADELRVMNHREDEDFFDASYSDHWWLTVWDWLWLLTIVLAVLGTVFRFWPFTWLFP